MVISNPKSREIGRYVNDYPSAAQFLGDKGSRKLANNTKVYRVMLRGYYGLVDEIHVRFHNTDIVSYREDGIVTLNTGGHHTSTTKQRMNELLPPGYGISQRKYKWFLRTPDGEVPFVDGMTLTPAGGSFGSRRVPHPIREENPGRAPRLKKSYPPLGTISDGTLRTEDLLSAFSDVCKEYGGKEGAKLYREYESLGEDDADGEEAQYLLEEMERLLNDIAPPYAHFGTSEGDGASFGFWPSMESLDEDVRHGDVLKVDAGDWREVPKGYKGYVMEVSDHGNVTLYAVNGNKHEEVWSVV